MPEIVAEDEKQELANRLAIGGHSQKDGCNPLPERGKYAVVCNQMRDYYLAGF
jgi:hypothetical protein